MDLDFSILPTQNFGRIQPVPENPPSTQQKIVNVVKGIFATLLCLTLYTINPLYFIASIGYGMSFPQSVKETTDRIGHILTTFPGRSSAAIGFALLVTPWPIIHFYASIFAGAQLGVWVHNEALKYTKSAANV